MQIGDARLNPNFAWVDLKTEAELPYELLFRSLLHASLVHSATIARIFYSFSCCFNEVFVLNMICGPEIPSEALEFHFFALVICGNSFEHTA